MKTIPAYLILVFFCASCANNASKSKTEQVIVAPVKKDSAKKDSAKPYLVQVTSPTAISVTEADENEGDGYIHSMDDTDIVTGTIKYNLFTFHPATISGQFNLDSALIKLYPGHYYKLWTDDTDSVVFEAWRCWPWVKHVFHGPFNCDEDPVEIFPLRDNNETQIRDSDLVTDNGKRSIIVSFCNTEFEEDFVGMGRCEGAFMGLAIFTEDSSKWRLTAFNPAIGYYGYFQEIPWVGGVKYSKGNVGCWFEEIQGGSSGPYYGDIYLVRQDRQGLEIILKKKETRRDDRPRNVWSTVFQMDSTQGDKEFPDVIFTTKGDYYSKGYDATFNDDTVDAPNEIWPITKKKDNFDYTIITRYTFENGKYKYVSEKITTRHHVVTEAEKNFKYSW